MRWCIRQQIMLSEIALLEEQLIYISSDDVQAGDAADAESTELLQQLGKAREKLSSLGPSPKPMMG